MAPTVFPLEIQAYLDGCGAMRRAFEGMSLEQVKARPVDGKWSSLEVLCHLVDMDLGAAVRIRLALVEDEPRVSGVTLKEMAGAAVAGLRDMEKEISLFVTLREETASILRAVPAADLQRKVIIAKANGEVVKKTILELVAGITGHVVHHLGHVAEKRKMMERS